METAKAIHEVLEKIGVPNYCKTSGFRGLHIAVPLGSKYTFEQAKQFSQVVAMLVHQELPKFTSLERSPKNRQKRVYIDCFQNNFGQTMAMPFSLRVKPGTPVSMPLYWEELDQPIKMTDFHFFNALERIKQNKDPFRPVLQKATDLQKALKSLQKLF